jgi:hypothetical protein
MRRHRAPFSVLDTFFAVRSWVDCTTSTSGFDLRQAQPREGWCFVPNDHLVAVDVMLAQKIGLETDERGALATANNFTPR